MKYYMTGPANGDESDELDSTRLQKDDSSDASDVEDEDLEDDSEVIEDDTVPSEK